MRRSVPHMANDQVSILARVYMGVERHKITDFEAERTTYATQLGRNNQALCTETG